MKLRISFKTPNATDVVEGEVRNSCEVHWEYDCGCTACIDQKFEAEDQVKEIKEKLSKFIEFDEYITIEFDTEAGTATVVPLK